jgi:hypothetical protein
MSVIPISGLIAAALASALLGGCVIMVQPPARAAVHGDDVSIRRVEIRRLDGAEVRLPPGPEGPGGAGAATPDGCVTETAGGGGRRMMIVRCGEAQTADPGQALRDARQRIAGDEHLDEAARAAALAALDEEIARRGDK